MEDFSMSDKKAVLILSLQMTIANFPLISWNLIGSEHSNKEVNEVIYPCVGALCQSDSILSCLPLFENS